MVRSRSSSATTLRFGDEWVESLLGKIAVESADLQRLDDEGLVSRLGVFGLDFNGLVERPHAGKFLDIAFGVFERFLGVVAIGGSDGLDAA